IAAGLLALGSRRAFAVDLGFDYHNLICVHIFFPRSMRSDPIKIALIRRRLIERLEALPGVKSVAVAGRMPLAGGLRNISVSLDGRGLDDRNAPNAVFSRVTPSYFDTMGIPLVRGRNFTAQDTRDGLDFDPAPAIVSEATARQFWPGQDPIGKRITFGA